MAYQQQQLQHFPGYPYPTPVPSAKRRFLELLKKHYLPTNKFINEHIQIGVDDLTNLDHPRFVELCTFFKLNPVEKIRFEKLVNELSFGEEHFNHKASIDTYNHNKTIATSRNESLLIQQLDNEHEKMQYISKVAQFMMNRTSDKCALSHDQINKIFDAQKDKIIHLLQNKQQQLHDHIREFKHNQLSFIQNELKTIDEYQAEIRSTRSACSTVLESQQYGEDREDTISQIIQSLLSVHANHQTYRNIKQLNKSLGELSKEISVEFEPLIMESCIDKLVFVEGGINDDMKSKIIQINQLCMNSNVRDYNSIPEQAPQRKTRGVSMDMLDNDMHKHISMRNHAQSMYHMHSLNNHMDILDENQYLNNGRMLYNHQQQSQEQQQQSQEQQQHYIHPGLRNRPHSFAYNDSKLYDNILLPNSMNALQNINDEERDISSPFDSSIHAPLPPYSPPFASGQQQSQSQVQPGHNRKAMSFSQLHHNRHAQAADSSYLSHSFIQMQHSNGSSSVHSQNGHIGPPTLTQSESNRDEDGDIQALIMETIDKKENMDNDTESVHSDAHSIEEMYEPGRIPETKDDTPNPNHVHQEKEAKEDPPRIDSIDITNSDYLDCNPHELLNELNDKPVFIDSIAVSMDQENRRHSNNSTSSPRECRSRPISIQSASSQYAAKWAVYGVGNNMSYQFGLNHNNNIGDFEQMKWNIDDSSAINALSAYQLSITNNTSADMHDEEDEKKEVIATTTVVYKKTWNDCLRTMMSGPEWSMYLFGGGGLYCSGSNATGCFGMGKDKKGTYIQSLTQHSFFDGNDLNAIYLSSGCTSHHSFVKTDTNEIYAMGESSHYQLALDSEEMAKHKTNFWPQKISYFDKVQVQVSRIACGKKYSIFITEDGITYSCGENVFGALGFCDEVTTLKKPRVIERLQRAKAMEVVCGENHSVILDSIGKVWSFGTNNQFQLGRNTKNNLDYPGVVHIAGRKFSVVGQSYARMGKIASGANHVAVISESSKLYLWGANDRGQLGDGTQKVRYKAKQLLKNELIKDVQCGANHTVIITKERKVFVCGCNEYYQCQQQSVKSKDKKNNSVYVRNAILKPRLLAFENQPDIDQQIKRIFVGHNSTFVAVDTNMDIDRVCV